LSLDASYQEARRVITEFLLKARHARGAVVSSRRQPVGGRQ